MQRLAPQGRLSAVLIDRPILEAVICRKRVLNLTLMFLWKGMRGECPGFAVKTAPDCSAVCNIDNKAASSGIISVIIDSVCIQPR